MADLQSLIQSHIDRSATARQRISSMNHRARTAAVTGDWSAFEAQLDGRIRELAEQAGDGAKGGTSGDSSSEPAADTEV